MRFCRHFMICLLSLSSLPMVANGALTLTEIDLATGDIEITNTGSAAMGGALLEWCVPFSYGVMEAGTFSFNPGEVRTYNAGGPLGAADDLWIYLDRIGSFGATNFVTTGAVWGSDQSGQGRVNSVVSNTGGAAWASNSDFIDTSSLSAGQTLQAVFPGTSANTSSGWTIDVANLGTFEDASISGDFDFDGDFDCDDIDALCNDIAAGNNTPAFDLNGDGSVDVNDCDQWLADAGAANLASGNPYIRGDANLDGIVDVGDFNVWNNAKFTMTTSYCSGDFNCDGVVDTSDFNVWNNSKFTSSNDVSSVPEPGGLLLLLAGMGGLGLLRRNSR